MEMTQADLERLFSKVVVYGECWLHQGALTIIPNGYPQISYLGKRCLVHKLVCEFYHGPSSKFALHTCDVKRCCNPDHLYWGTRKNNQVDVRERTRTVSMKLTRTQVEEIKSCGGTCTATAEKYGVSLSLISKIRKGRVWA